MSEEIFRRERDLQSENESFGSNSGGWESSVSEFETDVNAKETEHEIEDKK